VLHMDINNMNDSFDEDDTDMGIWVKMNRIVAYICVRAFYVYLSYMCDN
jgi:hypothetical protein